MKYLLMYVTTWVDFENMMPSRGKKPDMKGHILHDSMDMKCLALASAHRRRVG